jgi:protein-tyrosine kinase
VSLIQNALEKMRRTGSAAGPHGEVASLREAVPAADPKLAAHAAVSPVPQARQIAIDWGAVRAAGYLPDEAQTRRLADHYRQIKRPLIDKALAAESTPDARMILLTSAMPGDGKTFTAVNLALSMARERDVSVLLVDADLPRYRISEIFGLRSEPGLVDALMDESMDVESCVIRTDVNGLDVLPAGVTSEHATELLASARMAQIVARLLSRNPRRLVLVDSAPLLGSTEAQALVTIPGQIVLVVRAGVTPRHAVLDAVARLDGSKFRGLILNDATTARGSGYYYGYSSYGKSTTESSRTD